MGFCPGLLKEKKMNQKLSIPIAIVIAGIIVGSAVYFSRDNASPDSQMADVAQQAQDLKIPTIVDDDHVLGDPNAQVSYFLYSDLECPFCQRFHSIVKQISEDYVKNGKIKLIYRHFPLASIHPNAEKFSQATECAAELGGETKFWDYMDKLIELQTNDTLKVAEEIGLDKQKFENCLNSNKYAQKISQSSEEAVNAGIQGTPHSIIVKGDKAYPVSGALPYLLSDPQFFQMLDEEQKKLLCLDNTQTCGIKIAIDKILSE